MAAIGSVWGTGTWTDDIWALDTWGDAQEATTSTPSGVSKGKAIRLREIEKREDLGEFIKAQLNLKHGDLLPKEQKPKQTKAQQKEKQTIEIAMKSMAFELEQERIAQANNDVLTLLMMAEM